MVSEVIKMDLDKLQIPDYNANTMPQDEFTKLKRNIKKYGYLEFIVANKRTNYTIVSGSHRKMALTQLGWKKAEVIVIDVSLAEEKVLSIAMNRIRGVFDQSKLEKLIQDIRKSDFNEFEFTGLSDFEFEMMDLSKTDDPFENEFNNSDLTFQTENEEMRGSPRPKKEEPKKEVEETDENRELDIGEDEPILAPNEIVCPYCQMVFNK